MPSPLQLLLLAPILLGAAPPQAEPAANPPAQAGPQDPRLATASAFTLPLYLQDLPPEIRSARVIHLVHKDVPGVARNVTRSREEALELAQHITALLGAGEDFEKLCREYSAAKNAVGGGVLGSFPPGLLAPPMDDFLFSAEVGEVSAPIEAENGIHVMQRIETYAATRHILIRGVTEESRAKAQKLRERIAAGEDFGELALAHSEDPYSAPNRGLFTLFERGPNDRLLKAAAFAARVGETVGPIESTSGYHLIQRVPERGHPDALREVTLVRVRAILISHDNTPLGGITADRPLPEAERLATEIRDRIRSGEDMAQLARTFNDDILGKERAGDLGWVHRGNPRKAAFLKQFFSGEPGELVGPILTNAGYVVARREI